MKYFDNLASVRNWLPNDDGEGDALDRANISLQERPDSEERDPFKLLVCHDFKGAYLPYEDAQGIFSDETMYTLEYLHLVSTFVYFSHHRVTIPPASWINVMHKNGVKILGTFIVEPGNTTGLNDLLEKDVNGKFIFVQKLTDMAAYYGFDGWLLNFEAKFPVEKFNLDNVVKFIEDLRKGYGGGITHNEIVWYDSLTIFNEVIWQNSLTLLNLPFFNASSALFTNYWWRPFPQVPETAALSKAMKRNYDVYMGIDVFGRGSFGGGQWGVGTALAILRPAGLSCAIFAPGWVFENFDGQKFEERNRKFWIDGAAADPELICRPVAEFTPSWEAGTELFFYTNFNRGYGKKWFQNGREISSKPWVHVGAQALLPTFYPSNTDNLSWSLDNQVAYNGGNSLQISYKPTVETKIAFSRLYKLNMAYNRNLQLSITYVLKATDKGRVAIYFNLKRYNGVVERHEIGLPVQDGWGTKLVQLDVGKTDEEGFGLRVVELGVVYIAPENEAVPVDETTVLRLGQICLSGYPQQKLPSIGKVASSKLINGRTSLNWTLDYEGFTPEERSQRGPKSKITGEFEYFIVYKGLGEFLGISYCLEFLLADAVESGAVYRVDGIAFDGQVCKGAWF